MEIRQLDALMFRPAFSVLPVAMDSREARAMLIAIGLQESRFEYRRQIMGPARGWWQFERGGLDGVLNHPATQVEANQVVGLLQYPKSPEVLLEALADNDVLATIFARLLLYTDSYALPALDALADESWDYYIRNWRPGRPHRDTWDGFWTTATAEA